MTDIFTKKTYDFEDVCPSNLDYYHIKNNTIIHGTCIISNKKYECKVPTTELNKWLKNGYINDCLLSVSKENKNFILTGISPSRFWLVN